MPSIIHSQVSEIPHKATTTGFDLPGFQIVECLGVVRGVVVRSRSVVGTLGEFGEERDIPTHQGLEAGADAVIGIRYDANEIMRGVTEVLCYGTAVRVKPLGE